MLIWQFLACILGLKLHKNTCWVTAERRRGLGVKKYSNTLFVYTAGLCLRNGFLIQA